MKRNALLVSEQFWTGVQKETETKQEINRKKRKERKGRKFDMAFER